MNQIQSTFITPSAVVPGVRFVLQRPTAVRRAALVLAITEVLDRIQTLLAEGQRLEALPAEQRSGDRVDLITKRVQAELVMNLKPLYIRWGLKAVENFTIDGAVPDVTGFITTAPDALVEEVLELCRCMSIDPPAPAPSEPAKADQPQGPQSEISSWLN